MPNMPDRLKKRYVRIPKPTGVSNSAQTPHWHSRGYLPHLEHWETLQMITFRLADALSRAVAERLADEPCNEEGEANYRRRIESFLDAGHGSCWLRQPEMAQIIKRDLTYFDSVRYTLHAWVIMPNHVHLLLAPIPPYSLSLIVKDLKSLTARKLNKLLDRTGKVWQEEYWDRYIRNERHYQTAREYILNNPVKAGLAPRPEDWMWCGLREDNSTIGELPPTAGV